jgi:pilus assembly protein CpaE
MPETHPSKNAGNWKTLLICPDSKVSARFLALASQQAALGPIFELPSYPYRSVLNETLAGRNPQLAFLDASSDPDRALATVECLLQIAPAIQIVVLLSGNDPDLILRCLRQGAAEFLMEPFTTDQLRPALEKLARLRPGGATSQRGRGRVICVMPAKGASGATTIAANLAMQWRRSVAKSLLLADLDPLTGTISFILKTKSPYSFMDAVQRASTLDEDLWKGMIATTYGVDVLLSPDNPVDGIQEAQDPAAILDFSRTAYETVIIDSSGAYGEWNISLGQLSDEILLVTTNELAALQGAQRSLSYLERHQVPRSKVRVIVNRYNRDVGLSREVIETALHMDVFHVIPSDYEAIQAAILEGKPVPPNSPFGKAIVALTEMLAGIGEARTSSRKASAFGGLLSFLAKRPAVTR